MDMCYDGALVMPSSYAVIGEEEMMYVEGGLLRVQMRRDFLNKAICQIYAERYLALGLVKRMTQLQIAQELFAHAAAYYGVSAINNLGIEHAKLASIKKSAAVVDIDDGGDPREGYMQVFSTIWYALPSM